MNSLLRKIVVFVVATSIGIGGATQAYAQSNTCAPIGVAFGFFNGVWNSELEATGALLKLGRMYGSTVPSTGQPIRYEKYYNYSSGFEDLVEVFEQRSQEQGAVLAGRFELVNEVVNGSGTWWELITNSVLGTSIVLDAILEDFRARTIQRLTTAFASPPTIVNYSQHRIRIDNNIASGTKMVLFAHSQGNLFVNPAADYARQRWNANAVKVVHVAPASPTLRGKHVLADKDLIINGLRLVGSVASITDVIPSISARPTGLNGEKDYFGHLLIETYVNPALAISSSVRALVEAALKDVGSAPCAPNLGPLTAWETTNRDASECESVGRVCSVYRSVGVALECKTEANCLQNARVFAQRKEVSYPNGIRTEQLFGEQEFQLQYFTGCPTSNRTCTSVGAYIMPGAGERVDLSGFFTWWLPVWTLEVSRQGYRGYVSSSSDVELRGRDGSVLLKYSVEGASRVPLPCQGSPSLLCVPALPFSIGAIPIPLPSP